jgi:hypothetical protein
LWFWPDSDWQGLTAFLEDVQTGVCDVVVSYISVVLSFLAERSDEDGVVLRGDEGDSVEMDKSGHGHSSDNDPTEITPTSNAGGNRFHSNVMRLA